MTTTGQLISEKIFVFSGLAEPSATIAAPEVKETSFATSTLVELTAMLGMIERSLSGGAGGTCIPGLVSRTPKLEERIALRPIGISTGLDCRPPVRPLVKVFSASLSANTSPQLFDA